MSLSHRLSHRRRRSVKMAVAAAADATQQTEKRMAAASTQHPPPPVLCPFFVFNNFGVGNVGWYNASYAYDTYHFTRTDLLLDDTPSVRQVREAAALHLSETLTAVKLYRRTGLRHRDGAVVFEIYNNRRGLFQFTDHNGTVTKPKDFKRKDKELRDEEPFLVVPGLINVIFVLRRWPLPAPPTPTPPSQWKMWKRFSS